MVNIESGLLKVKKMRYYASRLGRKKTPLFLRVHDLADGKFELMHERKSRGNE